VTVRRRRLAAAAPAAFICAGMSLAGCAARSGTPGPAAASGAAPASVAVRYGRAFFAGNFTGASRFVDPSSRSAFLALADGLGPASLSSRNLAAGSTAIRGEVAVVILTGTVCSSASQASLPPGSHAPAARCVTNSDPHSTSPVFRVTLGRETDGRWMIIYQIPSPGTGGLTGAPSSSQSPGSSSS